MNRFCYDVNFFNVCGYEAVSRKRPLYTSAVSAHPKSSQWVEARLSVSMFLGHSMVTTAPFDVSFCKRGDNCVIDNVHTLFVSWHHKVDICAYAECAKREIERNRDTHSKRAKFFK